MVCWPGWLVNVELRKAFGIGGGIMSVACLNDTRGEGDDELSPEFELSLC